MNTPQSKQSFYSPNFFNRRFQSECAPNMANTTEGTTMLSSIGQSPFCNNQSPSVHTSGPFSRVTPLRRSLRIRSMVAAAHSENLAFANSLSSTGSVVSSVEKPSSMRKSAGMNLLQQATHNFGRQRGISLTPMRGPIVSDDVLLNFEHEGISYGTSIEYCLDWISDEPFAEEFGEEPSRKKNRSGSIISKRYADELTIGGSSLEHLDDLLDFRLKKQANCILASKLRQFPTLEEQQMWTSLRWPIDIRLHNVSQMLDSSKPILIPNVKYDSTSTDEREQQEQFLIVTALKTITRPMGLALMNFCTEKPVPNTPWAVKPICLNGRINPGRMQIDYPITENNNVHKANMDWANFYNGVAHGLSVMGFQSFNRPCNHNTMKFPKEADSRKANMSSATTATDWNIFYGWKQANSMSGNVESNIMFDWDWLYMNLRAYQDCPPIQAGFLLASGLTCHIRSISLFDIHAFLTKNDKFLIMALLLGCSVAHRGTSDVHIYKVLATHLPFLLMPTLCEFRIEATIQTAAIVSLGFLFAETANASLTNQLIDQMARETFDSDQSSERYSFVLAAGFAVGLINLGKGKELADTEIPITNTNLSPRQRLIKLLNGGERQFCLSQSGNVKCAAKIDYSTGEAAKTNSSHVKESSYVNIHLTSPAACIALGLMYLRTGDKSISNALEIPNTLCDIERIRPDVLMLRTLSNCLVNYQKIGCTIEWVEEQVPEIVKKYARNYMGSKNMWWSNFVDVNCVAQAYFYCCAGACFAMALRYASTCDPSVQKTIQCFYERVQMDNSVENMFACLSSKAGKNCTNACINVCATCLAMVMAGSGDLQTTQTLRKIRNLKRPYQNKDPGLHSHHVTVNMALGLLYLGHGRLSLSKSNIAIASLVISFFPTFPHSMTDNRIYFQPLRFVWTLAIESRFLVTVDSQSMNAVSVGIQIIYKDQYKAAFVGQTPLILPPLHQISTITLAHSTDRRQTIDEYDGDTTYNLVTLNLQNPKDNKKLRECLHRYHGRFPLTKQQSDKSKGQFVKSTSLLSQAWVVIKELGVDWLLSNDEKDKFA
ncbi:anaphase-promoting complex subunit 1 [Ditylenchus destructor]|uniref:Anaphase-promoting complex subunit 1 n=1 Tax=Ditylenchus destructor TaxID=166010 RepID=A0AAD4NCD5_9BILA|nr:anaphase-promoting complex subunit 1 [Ditylenchus destructor]